MRGGIRFEELEQRLLRAERNFRAALLEHNGTSAATVRYRDARAELVEVQRIIRAVLRHLRRRLERSGCQE